MRSSPACPRPGDPAGSVRLTKPPARAPSRTFLAACANDVRARWPRLDRLRALDYLRGFSITALPWQASRHDRDLLQSAALKNRRIEFSHATEDAVGLARSALLVAKRALSAVRRSTS